MKKSRKNKKQKSLKMNQNEQNKELPTNKIDIGNRILNLTIIFSYRFCLFVIFAIVAVGLFYREYPLEVVISTGYTVLTLPLFVLIVATIIKFRKISKE